MNFGIALKFGGDDAKAREFIDSFDWSASIREFKLARAVLMDDFDLAASIMLEIGKQGELVTESGYHTWPLFKVFRETPQFLEAYRKVYEYEFASQLKREIDASKAKAASNISAAATALTPEAPESSDGSGDTKDVSCIAPVKEKKTRRPLAGGSSKNADLAAPKVKSELEKKKTEPPKAASRKAKGKVA